MDTAPILVLLAQATMAAPIVFPVFFTVVFCAVYILLILLNTVFALVSGFRQRPRTLLVSLKMMKVIAGSVAGLVCIWVCIWYFTYPESVID